MTSTLVETVAIPTHTLVFVDAPARHIYTLHEKLALQLAHLASQHQKSEYNRFKFGPRGAPVTYIPMSVHMPDHTNELKARQASYTDKSWWLSEKPHNRGRAEFYVISSDEDIAQELLAAIDSPLSKNSVRNVHIKTSETHPIHVSTIIPFELLPIISSHLVEAHKSSPVLYDVPPAYYLDRVTIYQPPTESSPPIPAVPPPLPPLAWNRSTVTQALQIAMNTGIRGSLKVRGLPLTRTTSAPPPLKTTFTPELTTPENEKPSAGLPPTPPKSRKTHHLLGNLFLSSCPGKKVRLSGPVNGRVGVCRDLGRDLTRIKDLGVGCIVCCLDDTELEYLGVSWSEYARIANGQGLDLLRIPTPEGLAPMSPHTLDAYLTRLIENYTLRNIPILVHCRGGVGRAGLIACCWILKLGLCGWVDTQPSVPLEGRVRRDTLQLIERVIGVVRRRRSVKAIETFEQVLFLVEFVEYLRESAMLPSSPRSLNESELTWRVEDVDK